jgi:hypothetical protein
VYDTDVAVAVRLAAEPGSAYFALECRHRRAAWGSCASCERCSSDGRGNGRKAALLLVVVRVELVLVEQRQRL